MKYTIKDENENEYYPFHFPFDNKKLTLEEKSLFATSKFKLAVKLTILGMLQMHYPDAKIKQFLKILKMKLIIEKMKNQRKILMACINQY